MRSLHSQSSIRKSGFTSAGCYDTLNHLKGVSMPRVNGTQTRSWTYDAGTQRLTQATAPESGTTQYVYNPGEHGDRRDGDGEVRESGSINGSEARRSRELESVYIRWWRSDQQN